MNNKINQNVNKDDPMTGLEYLHTRVMFGMKAGLENIQQLCQNLGEPQKKFPSIHVVGSNGKGSTAWYLAGILQAHGLRTGLYTSPHLVSVRERIRIDGHFIPADELDRLLLQVRSVAQSLAMEPTFFEVITAAAFCWFAQSQADIVILEAGLGGRLDSTNAANSVISILTSIALEHTEHLGTTTSLILREKLGVLRPDTTLICSRLGPELAAETASIAAEMNVTVNIPAELDADIHLGNAGGLYRSNAALSWEAARMYLGGRFSRTTAMFALQHRSWPGRMHFLRSGNRAPHFILDGAHNPHAMQALAQNLELMFPARKMPVVFAALAEKDVDGMLKLLGPKVSHWYCTRTAHPKMREPTELVRLCQQCGYEASVLECNPDLRKSLHELHRDDIPVIITGSLYLVGLAVSALRDDYEDLRPFRELEPFTNEVK